MAATMDITYIAASYSIPEPTLQELLGAPTAELVKSLLQKVEQKARDNEGVQAEKLRADVELETAVRSGNARAKQLRDSVDKGLKEIEELRKKLTDEENSRAAVQSELDSLKSSSSTSTSELQALHSRIAALEASNSDALALLESKTTAHDSLAEDLSSHKKTIVALRQDVSKLEEDNQTAANKAMTAKFREQSLQQEVDLLTKNNQWFEDELKRRGTEHTNFRKEKGAKITELQHSLEDALQTSEGLRNTESTLRDRVNELNQKLDKAYEDISTKAEDAIRSEQSLSAERDGSLRLAELQKKSADTARARQHELEQSLDQIREDAATEIGNLQADINTERTQKEAAERRIAELDARVETLESELSTTQNTAVAPGTPRRAINGFGARNTPGREGSPGMPLTPGGRLKNGLSYTQLYTQYTKAKAELEAECRRTEDLTTTLDQMVQDLENQSPEIEEAQMENAQLRLQVEELSQLVQQANNTRDNARKAARKWEGTSQGLTREADILRQQLRDLSAQLRMAHYEMQVREQGLDSLSAADHSQLELLARGELDEGAFDGMTATAQYISQHLVIFRNIAELQAKNVQLLELTRKLGEEMEGEEARSKRNQQEKDKQELEDLRTRLAEHQDLVQSLTTRSESFVQERDMYRRMLSHRGQLPPESDLAAVFGQSVDSHAVPSTPGRLRDQSMEPSQESRTSADFGKLIKDMQQHFDSYREEAATNHAHLKQLSDRLSKENSDLQAKHAQISSQLTLTSERYDMLKSNYTMLQTENGELQKRTQSLSQLATQQDLKTQQVAEDLIEAQGLADSMRKETTNLKAERELWKKIESRLTEDNQSLMDERSRLNKMISDFQSLSNEREHTEAEARRRLQSRIESLESELASAKRKLDEEVDQSRKAALRREYEQEQNRTRIEDLLKGSSNAKEELVAAKTQRDQLQARLDEMKVELRNAEAKAQALQPQPTSRPAGSKDGMETDENALTQEQQLSVEVADLKRDLEMKQSELQQAEEQIEQYKAIAQDAEDALQNHIETTEQYRETTDAELAEKVAKIQDLEKRVSEISSELATTNTELSQVRSNHEDSAAKLNEQKTFFESELARVRDESERLAETARLHQEDLKAQAVISQQAQQHYEDELVKHAEAATNLQKIRGEFNQLRTEVAGYKADAEAAKAVLSQNEDSWTETRARYEQEITDLKNRREDVLAQNRRVHQQLEEVSAQIAALKQNRTASGESEQPAAPASASDNSQEIIRYLRQDKEIVDMQYELTLQESKRLKQQLDHAQAQLDQTREKLEKERLSQADREQSAANHSKLMQTINELNVFRESNTSLRNEARSAQEQLANKIKEAGDLQNQLEPIQTRLREVEQDLESKEGEIKLLQEDRDRWQKRTQDIMSKYDRVDPAELEGLKNQITDLQAERERLLAERQPLQEQIDTIPEKIRLVQEEAAERRQKLIDQSKTKVRELMGTIRDKNTQIESSSTEQTKLSQEISSLKEELASVKAARDEALVQAKQKHTAEESVEDGQIDESAQGGLSDQVKADLESRISLAEAKANDEAAQNGENRQAIQGFQARILELEGQISSLEQSLEAANTQISSLQSAPPPPPIENAIPAEQLENLQAELTKAQQEVQQLRAKADIASSISNIPSDGSKPVAEQVSQQVELIRTDLEAKHAERVRQAEETYEKRADKMKKQLSTKLAEGKQGIREQLKQEHTQALDQLQKEHESEIARIKNETNTALADSKDTAEVKQEEWKPSQAQIKDLISTDPGVKSMLARNVQQKVDQQKEAWTLQIKQEEERVWSVKMEEANKNAETAKEKAIAAAKEMESKRMSVKLNMTDQKARTAMAKIDVVANAATETPQRPVGEVWNIAKDAKAVVVPRPPTATQPGAAPKIPATPQSQQQAPRQPSSIQQPAVVPTSGQNTQPAPASALFVPHGQTPQQVTSFGQPTVMGGSHIPMNPFANQLGNQQNRSGSIPNIHQQQGQLNQQPRGLPQSSGTGTGPAALRGILSNNHGQQAPPATGIPRPGIPNGQAGRGRGGIAQLTQNHNQQQTIPLAGAARGGSSLPRGPNNTRGRGGGRGGNNQHVQTSGLPNQGGRNSPGSGQNSPRGGSMNPGARQFVPGPQAGVKRPHDGDGSSAANQEKKLKGAGEE